MEPTLDNQILVIQANLYQLGEQLKAALLVRQALQSVAPPAGPQPEVTVNSQPTIVEPVT